MFKRYNNTSLGRKASLFSLYTLSLLFLLSSCSHELLNGTNSDDSDLIEGEKTTLLLGLNNLDMKISTRGALDPQKEREIHSLAVFIFDVATGLPISSIFHSVAGVHAVDIHGNPDISQTLNPDGTNYIPIETITGNNRRIYVIANYDANVIEDLKLISSESELKESIFKKVANPLLREFGLMKYGMDSINIRKDTPIVINLDYVSAKVTLNVNNLNTANFKVHGWTIGNIPSKGYIVPRSPIASNPNFHDAVDISSDDDYYNDFADQKFDFEKVLPITAPSAGTEYSSTIYLFENRAGGRIKRTPPEGGDDIRSPYQLKAWYAPEKATYIKVYGTLTQGGVTKQIVITHYLGEDNFGDYNIWRGKHYIYNITISSLGEIDIDTNIATSLSTLRIDPPADPLSIDAHFGFRMIALHTYEFTDPEYTVDIEVLNAINSTEHPQWVDLSLTPIAIHQIKNSSSAEEFSKWQQDGGADYKYVRTKFVPKKAVRNNISYSAPVGSIGTAQLPDDDTSLPFSLASHRMCKKITNIPTRATSTSLTTPINILLYTDEYVFIDGPLAPAYREAVIRVTLKRGNVDVEYNHFTIRQYPPIRYMKLPNSTDNSAILVERVEEYEHMFFPNIALDRQMLAGLQWGPFLLPNATHPSKGNDNTLYAVYTNGPAATTRNANDYLATMYGSEGGSWQFANNAKIEDANSSTPTEGNPSFNLPLRTAANYVNTIYNTTAARYCHEKNWDINGNGNIDPEETFWYLPSAVELQQYWTLHELLDLHTDYYWTSNQASDNEAYAISMMSSPADADRVFTGVLQKMKKTGWHFSNRPRVRCMRRATGTVAGVAPIIRQLANKNMVIDCSNLPGEVYTTESKMGISQADYGAVHRANDKIFKKLEIQPQQPTSTSYYMLHLGNGLCDATKGWRLPTQREMLLLWALHDKIETIGGLEFAPFVKTGTGDPGAKYWTMTRGLRAHYLVDFSTGLSDYVEFSQSTPLTRYYRCVRELN